MTYTLYYATIQLTTFRSTSIVGAMRRARAYGAMCTHLVREDGRELPVMGGC
jgi:hypothetical protein